MTLCNEWTLVKDLGEIRYAKPLPCRSWRCEYCAPRRKEQLMAQAASGEPLRFLTLTVNPSIGNDPEHRLRLLANAWRIVVKRLRRKYAPQPIEYLAVVEETHQGEPHLHILLRSPYIPQSFISRAMQEIINAPIVDIRRIRNPKEVVRYVAKYITKAPAQFGHAKRYWASSNYDLGRETYRKRVPQSILPWVLLRENLHTVVERWIREHYAVRRDQGTTLIGIYSHYEIKYRSQPDG